MRAEIIPQTAISKRVELVGQICDYIRQNPAAKITLISLGEHFGVSPYHLQRIFVDIMGISPRRYQEECRVSILKLHLNTGKPVMDALRGTGYASQSWLYEDSCNKLGMTPATYRKGASGMQVIYATGTCPIGRIIVAATTHGVCTVNVGENDDDLVAALRREYPKAQLERTEKAKEFLDGINQYLQGQQVKLPLDLKGTDFQLKVWSALQRIPLGETRSYSDVAEAIGKPKAVRAVANACASNPVPLIVPCHRVINKDGSIGGYGLGVPKKKVLLANERAIARATKEQVATAC